MNRMTDLRIREPRDWMRRMVQELDRWFDEPSLSPARLRGRDLDELEWMPQLELFERDGRLVARVDLPGLKTEDITIEATEDTLTISGERRREVQETKADWTRSERSYGRFQRMIPLPDGVKPADIKATFINGVLEVTVPVPVASSEPLARKVPVEEPAKGSSRVAA